MFKFKLGDTVTMDSNKERASIIGRAEFSYGPPTYQCVFLEGINTKQVWQAEHQLQLLPLGAGSARSGTTSISAAAAGIPPRR